jgi:hypothetical protein
MVEYLVVCPQYTNTQLFPLEWIEEIIYNYGLHEKLMSIIIKLRKGYFRDLIIMDINFS